METSDKQIRPLTPAHLRALERIGDPGLREAAAVEMAYMDLPGSAAEAYINAVLHPDVPKAVRSFLMTLEATLPEGCEYIREDAENCVKVTLRCQYKGASD